MGYLQNYRAFANDEFRGTVWFAARKIAADVHNEVTTTEFHAQRDRLASQVLAATGDANAFVTQFVLAALANVTVAGNIDSTGTYTGPDGDLEFVISSAWNAVADVTSV